MSSIYAQAVEQAAKNSKDVKEPDTVEVTAMALIEACIKSMETRKVTDDDLNSLINIFGRLVKK